MPEAALRILSSLVFALAGKLAWPRAGSRELMEPTPTVDKGRAAHND